MNRPFGQLLTWLSALCTYPKEDWPARLRRAKDVAGGLAPSEALGRLAGELEGKSLAELEEAYVAAFDFDPASTLELGWHLYGEDYRRGEFLVRMRQLLREHGVEEEGLLPDHMALALRLLPKLSEEEAVNLVHQSVLPALAKVQEALGKRGSPFAWLMAAIGRALEEAAPAKVAGGSHGRG